MLSTTYTMLVLMIMFVPMLTLMGSSHWESSKTPVMWQRQGSHPSLSLQGALPHMMLMLMWTLMGIARMKK